MTRTPSRRRSELRLAPICDNTFGPGHTSVLSLIGDWQRVLLQTSPELRTVTAPSVVLAPLRPAAGRLKSAPTCFVISLICQVPRCSQYPSTIHDFVRSSQDTAVLRRQDCDGTESEHIPRRMHLVDVAVRFTPWAARQSGTLPVHMAPEVFLTGSFSRKNSPSAFLLLTVRSSRRYGVSGIRRQASSRAPSTLASAILKCQNFDRCRS